MRTRIDRAGRLVIPRELRRALRLDDGGEVVLAPSPEGVSIRPAGPDPTVTVEDGVAVVSTGGPTISNDETLGLIDRDRDAR